MSDSKLTFETVFGREKSPSRPVYHDNFGADVAASPTKEKEAFLKKTPVTILEEGSKFYQVTASWNAIETPMTSGPPMFKMIVQLRGTRAEGVGGTKKAAKHKAAVAYLHEIIRKGNRKDFSIPGDTDEEAHANIDIVAEKCDESSKKAPPVIGNKEFIENDPDKDVLTAWFIPEKDANQNWIGKLQERAQKYKMDAPIYEDVIMQDNKGFVVTCTMCKQKTRGISGQKKLAKSNAAYLMMKVLEKDTEALRDQATFTDILEDQGIAEDLTIVETSDQAMNEPDRKLALETILSDTSRFENYTMEFHHSSVNEIGRHQIVLEIITTRPVSPEDELQMGAEHTQTAELMRVAAEKEKDRAKKAVSDIGPRVFCGNGRSEEDAQQSAYLAALIHFNTYSFIQKAE